MPQASAYLPDESDSLDPDDTQRLNNSKPETWPLFLPSAISRDDRPLCYKGVVETEGVLRLAQLDDGLVDLRRFRRALRNLRLYFKTNMAGEGQKTQTKSRAVETGVNARIKRSVGRYRTARHALLELDPTGVWTNEYRELRDEDNRGPLKEAGETGTGDGRYSPSWIWVTPSAMVLPGEGSDAEQREINETARHEWMTCRARADRWIEEEALLEEEMRRVVTFLAWKYRSWSGKVGVRANSCAPDIQHGISAYARKQANIHREIAISFAAQWLPYFDACGLEPKWAAEFPWVSEARSHKTKLPKWFSITEREDLPNAAPHVPSAMNSSPPGATEQPQIARNSPDTRNEQDEGGNRERDERFDDDEEGSDDEGSDDEGQNYKTGGYEGYEGHDNQGYDDEDSDNEFGFEYDDDYMS